MTHYVVIVALDQPEGFWGWSHNSMDNIAKLVAEALEPYSEEGEWFKDGSRWDWWVLGGRWMGDVPNLIDAKTAGKLHSAGVYFPDYGPTFLYRHNWHESGRTGWFGMQHPTECEIRGKDVKRCRWKDEKTEALLTCWNESKEKWHAAWFDRLIKPLPDDTLLVAVDCHV